MSSQLPRLFLIMVFIIGVLILNGNMINGLPFEEIVAPQARKVCTPGAPLQLTVCLKASDYCSGYCYVPPKNFGLCY
jgi:hypothetical protein